MLQPEAVDFTRRAFLRLGLVVPATLALAGCGASSSEIGRVAAQELEPTPSCGENPSLTPPQTDGPFYTPSTPQRVSLLESGLTGPRMVLAGYVLSRQCQPVPGALLDFWQADAAGAYDNAGYRLRGHQFADENGRYELETIVPGLYPGRTRHFHVKVQAPGGPILTTQLYFPNEPSNSRDGIFSPALVIAVQDTEDAKRGVFNFVVNQAS